MEKTIKIFKSKFTYLLLIIAMLFSALLLTIPKTSAWTGVYPDWDEYRFDVSAGVITEKKTNTFSETTILITHGPAEGQSFSFVGIEEKIDELQGEGDFLREAKSKEVGDTVVWDVSLQLWKYGIIDKTPVLSGETAFVTTIDNPISINDIMSRIEALDEEDGNITHLIQINESNTTYNENITSIGDYELHLYVEDSSNNRAELIVHVLVKDITEPVITGKSSYNQSYTKKLDVNTVLNALSVSDNYDTDLSIQVDKDNYTSNYSKIGSYTITFKATDSSGNTGNYTVTIKVVDDVAPVFSGPKTITKGQSNTLILDDILSQISVTDAIDKNVSFVVKTDNYTGNGHKTGDWTIVLEATDSSDNKATHTITVTVADNIPPVFYVDNFFVHVDDIVNLTRQDIIDLLIATGQLNVATTTSFSFPLNEYEGNESVPGIYAVVVESKSKDGSSKQVSLAVQVNDTGENDDDIIVDPNVDTFLDKIWNHIKEAYNWSISPVKEDSKFYNGYYILIGVIGLSLLSAFIPKKKKRKYKRRNYRR